MSAGTMGRSIQPNPDAPRCLGKNGDGTCAFPAEHFQWPTVSPNPIGRGNPGDRTNWTGTARQFQNPASTEAIAYGTQRDGGTRRYHASSDAIGKQFPCLH